ILLEYRLVLGDEKVVGTQRQRILALAGRMAEHGDVRTHGVAELDGHMAESAQADHAQFVTRLEPEMPQRRIGGDARAQQRCRALERNAFRDRENVILIDGDAGRIAAIGRRLLVLLVAVIGQREARLAKLLLARAAGLAAAAGIDEAADADDMAGLPLLHMIADLGYPADDLVTGDHGKDRVVPLVLHLMKVRVANAAIENVDQHVVRTRLATLERPGNEI